MRTRRRWCPARSATIGMGIRSAKTVGASPVTLYLFTENADKVVAAALKLGATQQIR